MPLFWSCEIGCFLNIVFYRNCGVFLEDSISVAVSTILLIYNQITGLHLLSLFLRLTHSPRASLSPSPFLCRHSPFISHPYLILNRDSSTLVICWNQIILTSKVLVGIKCALFLQFGQPREFKKTAWGLSLGHYVTFRSALSLEPRCLPLTVTLSHASRAI